MSIKIGDWVAFQVGITAIHNYRAGLSAGWVHENELIKILPPDPHAELKDAVVEAAIAWGKAVFVLSSDEYRVSRDTLIYVVKALLAAQHPPSKYAGLRKAVDDLDIKTRCGTFGVAARVESVIFELLKLEAEERG